ncbi:hypothetical protein P7C73_g106, partial [Tremellales sp. Uapishka_1]
MFWDPMFNWASAQTGAPPDQLKGHTSSSSRVMRGCLGWSLVSPVDLADLSHIRRYVTSTPSSTIEITGSQMVLSMKLITFAWNVHDGRSPTELAARLAKIPSPLAFLGYCFFFPSILVGPSFDYATYSALVSHTLFYDSPDAKGKRKVPIGRKRVAYLHLVIGLAFLGVYATYGSAAGYDVVLSPIWEKWGLVAFISGGLETSLGKQFRKLVRPYALRSTPAKRAYDFIGWIMVQINLNYIVSSFLLLSFRDSIRAWHRMYWYGHILTIASLLFFRLGGKKALRQGLGEKPVAPATPVPSFSLSPSSPTRDEDDTKDLRWVAHDLDTSVGQDQGDGVHPDTGFVEWMDKYADSTGSQTPVTR